MVAFGVCVFALYSLFAIFLYILTNAYGKVAARKKERSSFDLKMYNFVDGQLDWSPDSNMLWCNLLNFFILLCCEAAYFNNDTPAYILMYPGILLAIALVVFGVFLGNKFREFLVRLLSSYFIEEEK